ncbi:RidA family protein [Embleya sp. NPDC050154]|uniref:RidA family protein n=1 Tax=unclassified Embleya TaxID=2699296 RepID=UPI0037BA856F
MTNSEHLPQPLGPYSHVQTAGNLVFCAGQLALDADTSKPLSHLPAGEQTAIVLRNLERVLIDSGSSLGQVLKTTIYLADLSDYAEVNTVYAAVFGDHRPARATLEVSRLLGDLAVEIDAVATSE